MGKINSNYQTVDSGLNEAIKKSPTKRGKASPMRSLRPKSPSTKNKNSSVVNLKPIPGKEDANEETHFLLQSNLNFNFEEIDENDKS